MPPRQVSVFLGLDQGHWTQHPNLENQLSGNVITDTWHQTSHQGEAVLAIALGYADMIMMLISKFLFFHLKLTVNNLIIHLKSFQSILMWK